MRPVVILAVVLSGCAAVPAVPAAGPPSPQPVVLLVKAERRGGLCVSGSMCESSITVRTDGTYTWRGNADGRSGTLSPDRFEALAAAVEQTGLASAPPFTGTCPVAYDGQEQVLTWLVDGEPVSSASCERVFDPADPLVVAAEELYAELA